MTEVKPYHNILLIGLFALIVTAIVALIAYLTIGRNDEVIQGQVEVSEYRVSSKIPGRIQEIRVREGDHVQRGDTVAIIDAPDVNAKKAQALGAEQGAQALSDMAQAGARSEQIQGAKELWEKSKVGLDIAQKTYERVQHLYDEGVVSAQKRDEAEAQYQAAQKAVAAAKSQYDMAVNGARADERRAAAAQVNQARGAMQEVNSYLRETYQIATADGEVTSIYPKVGELVGAGSPIATVSMMDDMWGTFNVREDMLNGLKNGQEFTAWVPALERDIRMKVYNIKDKGSFASWQTTSGTGGYDQKTFEVKARPVEKADGLHPGMSLVIRGGIHPEK